MKYRVEILSLPVIVLLLKYSEKVLVETFHQDFDVMGPFTASTVIIIISSIIIYNYISICNMTRDRQPLIINSALYSVLFVISIVNPVLEYLMTHILILAVLSVCCMINAYMADE